MLANDSLKKLISKVKDMLEKYNFNNNSIFSLDEDITEIRQEPRNFIREVNKRCEKLEKRIKSIESQLFENIKVLTLTKDTFDMNIPIFNDLQDKVLNLESISKTMANHIMRLECLTNSSGENHVTNLSQQNPVPSLSQEYTLGYDPKPHFICEFCKALRYEDHPNSFCCQSYYNKNCGEFENDVRDESTDKWNSKFDFLKETHTKDDINFIKMIHVGSQAMSNLIKNPTLDESPKCDCCECPTSEKKTKTYWTNVYSDDGKIQLYEYDCYPSIEQAKENIIDFRASEYVKTISFTIDEVQE